MSNLSFILGKQGRWDEAEDFDIQVMETRKRIQVEGHPETLSSMEDLALSFRNHERWKEAEGIGLQIIETRKRV